MKKISLYISALALAVGCFTACEDDKDTFTVQTPAASTVEQSVSTLVINDANLNEIVYTLNFSASDGDLKNDAGAKLGSGTYIVECSLTPDFTGAVKSEVVTVESGNNSKSYTGTDLNTLAASLGAEAEKATTVYFRVIHTYNEKTAALGTPSNVVELNLTPCKVVPTLNVLSKDGSEVVAKLQLNSATNLYEGEYTYKEWNFYFADALDGTVYGCDDAYTKPDDGVNRSCNIVKGRAIGDDYSMWFDPSIRPVTMKVDLENMTWTYERIATEKKDLTGVSVIIVGADLGWHDDWTPEEGTVVTANGDEYTAVFENLTLTAGSGIGFRATEPASAWIGKGGITVTEPLIEGADNLCVSETGVYTITLKAVAESNGSVSYSATAVMTGSASKKDLSGVHVIMVGDDLGWNDPWDQSVAPGVLLTANGDEYTAVFENVTVTAGSGFGFRATSPAATWVGKGGIAISDPIIEGPSNLGIAESGIYTFTFKAVAEEDGSVSYSLSAELTGAADKKDLSGVSIIIVGTDMGWHNEWTPDEGVTVTANGDEYTAVFENVALTDQFGFRATSPAAEWIGPDTFESLGDNLHKDGNIKANEAGIYTITVTAIANADGSITYKIAAEKTGDLSAQDLTDKEQGIKGAFDANSSDWVIIGKVAPVVNDNVYTYTIANITLAENQEFGFDGDLNWVGKGGLTVNSDLISEDLGNLSVKEAGTYTFVLVATANANGTVSYELTAAKAE